MNHLNILEMRENESSLVDFRGQKFEFGPRTTIHQMNHLLFTYDKEMFRDIMDDEIRDSILYGQQQTEIRRAHLDHAVENEMSTRLFRAPFRMFKHWWKEGEVPDYDETIFQTHIDAIKRNPERWENTVSRMKGSAEIISRQKSGMARLPAEVLGKSGRLENVSNWLRQQADDIWREVPPELMAPLPGREMSGDIWVDIKDPKFWNDQMLGSALPNLGLTLSTMFAASHLSPVIASYALGTLGVGKAGVASAYVTGSSPWAAYTYANLGRNFEMPYRMLKQSGFDEETAVNRSLTVAPILSALDFYGDKAIITGSSAVSHVANKFGLSKKAAEQITKSTIKEKLMGRRLLASMVGGLHRSGVEAVIEGAQDFALAKAADRPFTFNEFAYGAVVGGIAAFIPAFGFSWNQWNQSHRLDVLRSVVGEEAYRDSEIGSMMEHISKQADPPTALDLQNLSDTIEARTGHNLDLPSIIVHGDIDTADIDIPRDRTNPAHWIARLEALNNLDPLLYNGLYKTTGLKETGLVIGDRPDLETSIVGRYALGDMTLQELYLHVYNVAHGHAEGLIGSEGLLTDFVPALDQKNIRKAMIAGDFVSDFDHIAPDHRKKLPLYISESYMEAVKDLPESLKADYLITLQNMFWHKSRQEGYATTMDMFAADVEAGLDVAVMSLATSDSLEGLKDFSTVGIEVGRYMFPSAKQKFVDKGVNSVIYGDQELSIDQLSSELLQKGLSLQEQGGLLSLIDPIANQVVMFELDQDGSIDKVSANFLKDRTSVPNVEFTSNFKSAVDHLLDARKQVIDFYRHNPNKVHSSSEILDTIGSATVGLYATKHSMHPMIENNIILMALGRDDPIGTAATAIHETAHHLFYRGALDTTGDMRPEFASLLQKMFGTSDIKDTAEPFAYAVEKAYLTSLPQVAQEYGLKGSEIETFTSFLDNQKSKMINIVMRADNFISKITPDTESPLEYIRWVLEDGPSSESLSANNAAMLRGSLIEESIGDERISQAQYLERTWAENSIIDSLSASLPDENLQSFFVNLKDNLGRALGIQLFNSKDVIGDAEFVRGVREDISGALREIHLEKVNSAPGSKKRAYLEVAEAYYEGMGIRLDNSLKSLDLYTQLLDSVDDPGKLTKAIGDLNTEASTAIHVTRMNLLTEQKRKLDSLVRQTTIKFKDLDSRTLETLEFMTEQMASLDAEARDSYIKTIFDMREPGDPVLKALNAIARRFDKPASNRRLSYIENDISKVKIALRVFSAKGIKENSVIDGETAKEIGLVNTVVTPKDLRKQLQNLIAERDAYRESLLDDVSRSTRIAEVDDTSRYVHVGPEQLSDVMVNFSNLGSLRDINNQLRTMLGKPIEDPVKYTKRDVIDNLNKVFRKGRGIDRAYVDSLVDNISKGQNLNPVEIATLRDILVYDMARIKNLFEHGNTQYARQQLQSFLDQSQKVEHYFSQLGANLNALRMATLPAVLQTTVQKLKESGISDWIVNSLANIDPEFLGLVESMKRGDPEIDMTFTEGGNINIKGGYVGSLFQRILEAMEARPHRVEAPFIRGEGLFGKTMGKLKYDLDSWKRNVMTTVLDTPNLERRVKDVVRKQKTDPQAAKLAEENLANELAETLVYLEKNPIIEGYISPWVYSSWLSNLQGRGRDASINMFNYWFNMYLTRPFEYLTDAMRSSAQPILHLADPVKFPERQRPMRLSTKTLFYRPRGLFDGAKKFWDVMTANDPESNYTAAWKETVYEHSLPRIPGIMKRRSDTAVGKITGLSLGIVSQLNIGIDAAMQTMTVKTMMPEMRDKMADWKAKGIYNEVMMPHIERYLKATGETYSDNPKSQQKKAKRVKELLENPEMVCFHWASLIGRENALTDDPNMLAKGMTRLRDGIDVQANAALDHLVGTPYSAVKIRTMVPQVERVVEGWRKDGTYNQKMLPAIERHLNNTNQRFETQEARNQATQRLLDNPKNVIFDMARARLGEDTKLPAYPFARLHGLPFIGIPLKAAQRFSEFFPMAAHPAAAVGMPIYYAATGVPLHKALARQTAGHLMMYFVGMGLRSGMITGPQPANEKEREFWAQKGIRPYSVQMHWGNEVKQVELPFPLAPTLVPLINILSMQNKIEEDPSLTPEERRVISRNAWRESMRYVMRGLPMSDIWRVSEGSMTPADWGVRATSGFLPYSGLFRFANQTYHHFTGRPVPSYDWRGITPQDRMAVMLEQSYGTGVANWLQRTIPGFEGKAPRRFTYMGHEVTRERASEVLNIPTEWLTSLVGIPANIVSTIKPFSELDAEWSRLEFYPAMPSNGMTIRGTRVEFTDEEFRDLTILYGQLIERHLPSVIRTPGYQRLLDSEDRIEIIQRRTNQLLDAARKQLVKTHPSILHRGRTQAMEERLTKQRRRRGLE